MNSLLHSAPPDAGNDPATPDNAAKDFELIHSISLELIGERDVQELYGKIVDAAVSITGSQFGTMQRVCPPGDASGHAGELQLLAHRGLPPDAIAFWSWVSPSAYSSCTMALKRGERAIIPDFEAWPDIAGTDDLAAFRRTGIRSAQTTPLVSRNGRLLGMISTHWEEAHHPSQRDLRLLDILARQAADLLERTIAEEGVREREQELERTCVALREAETQRRETESTLRQLNETLEIRVEERSRELEAASEQMRHMQKMEAIGQLTGGVAHDFNNLLTIIRMSVDVLSDEKLAGEKRQKYVTAISDTAQRASRLTGQLLAFARRQALQPEVFDASVRIGAIAEMLKTVLGSRIRLVIEQIGTRCFVEADPSQFETAMVNMVVNARDAMDGEGTLVIAIDVVDAMPAALRQVASGGPFVSVAVTDTGSGMSAEQVERVFEPFFTTKDLGKGTGLGLSQVQGFIKQSGGEVGVVSELGNGTTFSVYLPRAGAPAPVTSPVHLQPAPASNISVLIVEDNAQVGELTSELLGELGYRTRYAPDANQALAILEDEHEAIDVVFSDVVMPGIDGVELGRRIRSRWPAMNIILTSGYSHVLAADSSHGFSLLHKPYSASELARALQQATRARLATP